MPGEHFIDGLTIESGTVEAEWSIRQWAMDDHIEFDWVIDNGLGGYSESDELFDTVEEAKRSLGVRD